MKLLSYLRQYLRSNRTSHSSYFPEMNSLYCFDDQTLVDTVIWTFRSNSLFGFVLDYSCLEIKHT